MVYFLSYFLPFKALKLEAGFALGANLLAEKAADSGDYKEFCVSDPNSH